MNSAALAYADGQKAVIDQLDQIGELLSRHERQQRQNPTSWGDVGDMEFVSARLAEIIQFLGGE